VLSNVYIKRLAAKVSRALKFTTTTVSNSTAYGNAALATRVGAKRGYAYTISYIYISKHSISKDAVYSIVVLGRED
jgi:hypothetical protein